MRFLALALALPALARAEDAPAKPADPAPQAAAPADPNPAAAPAADPNPAAAPAADPNAADPNAAAAPAADPNAAPPEEGKKKKKKLEKSNTGRMEAEDTRE